MSKKWTPKEVQILSAAYHQGGWKAAQEELEATGFNRPKYGIIDKARKLGLPTPINKWRDSELKILREAYPIGGGKLAHQSLQANGYDRSLSAVRAKCKLLKIKAHGNGQFKKGHVSTNKGKGMTKEQREKVSHTWYQKGHTPANTLQDGAVRTRINKEGKPYQFIRLGPKKWHLYHRHLWQQHHGDIPKGMVVYFKDGNTLNCQIDNLAIRSRGDHLRSNIEINGGCPAKRLTDRYIRALLVQRGISEEVINEEMIELKRAELLLKREIKNHGSHS